MFDTPIHKNPVPVHARYNTIPKLAAEIDELRNAVAELQQIIMEDRCTTTDATTAKPSTTLKTTKEDTPPVPTVNSQPSNTKGKQPQTSSSKAKDGTTPDEKSDSDKSDETD